MWGRGYQVGFDWQQIEFYWNCKKIIITSHLLRISEPQQIISSHHNFNIICAVWRNVRYFFTQQYQHHMHHDMYYLRVLLYGSQGMMNTLLSNQDKQINVLFLQRKAVMGLCNPNFFFNIFDFFFQNSNVFNPDSAVMAPRLDIYDASHWLRHLFVKIQYYDKIFQRSTTKHKPYLH